MMNIISNYKEFLDMIRTNHKIRAKGAGGAMVTIDGWNKTVFVAKEEKGVSVTAHFGKHHDDVSVMLKYPFNDYSWKCAIAELEAFDERAVM